MPSIGSVLNATTEAGDRWCRRSAGCLHFPLAAQPDQEIAFVANGDGNDGIHTMRANGDAQTNLAPNDADDHDPRWSPDGTKLLCHVEGWQADTWVSQVAIADASGGEPQIIGEGHGARFSPDRSRVAFTTLAEHGSPDVLVMKADGTDRRMLVEGRDAHE